MLEAGGMALPISLAQTTHLVQLVFHVALQEMSWICWVWTSTLEKMLLALDKHLTLVGTVSFVQALLSTQCWAVGLVEGSTHTDW